MAPTTTGTTKRLVHCKAHLSSNSRWKLHPNRFIIGDALLPQTATKLTETCGSEFGALLWRHLTPQKKTAIWVRNYSPSCTHKLQRYFGKFTSCKLLVRTNLYVPGYFLTTVAKLDNCCQRYNSDVRKKIYRCASTFSSLKCCGKIFIKIFLLSIRSCERAIISEKQ